MLDRVYIWNDSAIRFFYSDGWNQDVFLLDELLRVGGYDTSALERNRKGLWLNRFLSDQRIIRISHNTKTVKDLCDRVI